MRLSLLKHLLSGFVKLVAVCDMSKQHTVSIFIDEDLNMIVTRSIGKKSDRKCYTVENRRARKIVKLLAKMWGK